MDILIYSFSRCGSSTLLHFLEQEFFTVDGDTSTKSAFEPFGTLPRLIEFTFGGVNFSKDFKNNIVKTISGDLTSTLFTTSGPQDLVNRELTWYDQHYNFDKRIILYRENIYERVESMYAQSMLVQHQEEYGEYNERPYQLTHKVPWDKLKPMVKKEWELQNQIKKYKDDDEFLVISYEELYFKNGLDTLKDFLEISDWDNLHMMDTKNRSRKFNLNKTRTVLLTEEIDNETINTIST